MTLKGPMLVSLLLAVIFFSDITRGRPTKDTQRKNLTNQAATLSMPNPDNKPDSINNAGVATGVPLSKVRDGIKNASQFQDVNTTSALNAIDKLVSAVLPNGTDNSSSSDKHLEDSEGGSGSAMDPKEFNKVKQIPMRLLPLDQTILNFPLI
ncbi:hypothetical protein OS493_006790 [Desmophyllum pertusum]|uniref:Uncharacterized protein n=1 Tax=Desmophyllum pertusum TaxID=174260 RepID=A0A9W9ZSP7_9CNID|nr:hypothetical protein OS493_006790 [Desmophyllum pertusum]